jgi:hypothetical protein
MVFELGNDTRDSFLVGLNRKKPGYTDFMKTPGFLAALACAWVLASGAAHADAWALLVGINTYEDRNNISSLGTADQDAKALQKVLIEALQVPERNIDMLTSDGTLKPTRANILEALSRLKKNVKEGDTVYVFFSGHGIRIGVEDFLLPYDFRGADADTGKDTALPEGRFYELLSQVKARAVILAWDKCRNDPFANARSAGNARNTLSEEVDKQKGWNVVPTNGSAPTPAPKNAPPILVKFFACSPGQSAYEWRAQGRGYFSYYFEKGLRGAAADPSGRVTVGALKKYVETEVQAQVMRDESQDQTPYPEIIGPGADDFVLNGAAPSTPEGTPRSVKEPPPPSAPPADLKKEVPKGVARIIFETNLPELSVSINGSVVVSGISETIFKGKPIVGVIHDFKLTNPVKVELEATAPGYEPYRIILPLYAGSATLARFSDPALPKISSPTRSLSQPALVTKLLAVHKIDALAVLGRLSIQITPPRFRKMRTPDDLDLLTGLEIREQSVLTPFWKTLLTLRDGKATYSQKGNRLTVTTAEQTWQVEVDKAGRIERLIGERGGKPLTIRFVKYADFEGVPLPEQFQTDFNGKTGIFTVQSVARK